MGKKESYGKEWARKDKKGKEKRRKRVKGQINRRRLRPQLCCDHLLDIAEEESVLVFHET